MSRTIDADELKKQAEHCIETTDAFIELIDSAPTVDSDNNDERVEYCEKRIANNGSENELEIFRWVDAVEGFRWVVFYNGYGDLIRHWIEVLKNADTNICLRNRLDKKYNEYGLAQIEILNMLLVLWFGDYGASPRWGWIDERIGCRKFLEEIMMEAEK